MSNILQPLAPRLNDEEYVLKIREGTYFAADNRQIEQCECLIFNIKTEDVYKKDVDKREIRYPHSNYGLTQDIWLLDMYISLMNNFVNPIINGNPLWEDKKVVDGIKQKLRKKRSKK